MKFIKIKKKTSPDWDTKIRTIIKEYDPDTQYRYIVRPQARIKGWWEFTFEKQRGNYWSIVSSGSKKSENDCLAQIYKIVCEYKRLADIRRARSEAEYKHI